VNNNVVYAKQGDDGFYYLSADGGSSKPVTFWLFIVGIPDKGSE
jgi:hypothetical protein